MMNQGVSAHNIIYGFWNPWQLYPNTREGGNEKICLKWKKEKNKTKQ